MHEQPTELNTMEEAKYQLLENGSTLLHEVKRPFWGLSFIALMASALVNVVLIFLFIYGTYSQCSSISVCRSPYALFPNIYLRHRDLAGLENNFDAPFLWDNDWNDPNDTKRDSFWYNNHDSDHGVIALDNAEARALQLPISQPFPWDPKQKSIYITNGHHNLHCIISLRDARGRTQHNVYIAIDQYHKGLPQSLEWPHVLHCLANLRADILRNADDTPRFTVKSGARPGDGQIRQCRDWSQLEKFVVAHSGCYEYIKQGNPNISQIERMKYCPNDSPYLPDIRKYFGYDDGWNPWPYVEQETYLTKAEAP
ncbi:cytochrome p450 protein [Rutstroemia sp. NJR-2017a BVV2]|nr:cytochrome p450 protein [Rutstroemia sp. NJR-2017a BVV2]